MASAEARRCLPGGDEGLIRGDRGKNDVAQASQFAVRISQWSAGLRRALADLFAQARSRRIDVECSDLFDAGLAQSSGDVLSGFAKSDEADPWNRTHFKGVWWTTGGSNPRPLHC